MESLKLIRLSLVFLLLISLLINGFQCKSSWSLKKFSVWGRSSKPLSESESDSSAKHAELCEYVCKKEPEEGSKYCDCNSNELPEAVDGSSPSGQKQISLGDYFKQETNPAMRQQMCSLICSEDSNEGAKYCDCDGSKKPGKSQKSQSKFPGFQSLSDYFKSNDNDNSNDKSINSDPHTRQQLCEYICSDDPDEAKQYCDCNKIREEQNNLIASQSQNDHHDLNQHQRQGNNVNNNQNANGGNNQFSIKQLLSPNHGHSQEDICKVICAVEPDNDDGQCGCDNGTKETKLRWPWQRIRQWFG